MTVEKSSIGAEAGSIAPISIGLALFLAELCGVFYTGGGANPARSFGPDVVLGTFSSYHYIYCEYSGTFPQITFPDHCRSYYRGRSRPRSDCGSNILARNSVDSL